MTDAEWFLPLAGPRPMAAMWPATVMFARSGDGSSHAEYVPVLGPPVHRDAIAAPMSAEARAVLEAALQLAADPDTENAPLGAWGTSWRPMVSAIRAYARSLIPSDPLADAREALARIKASRAPDYCGDAVDRLEAALSKLGDKP